jgi:DNA-binding CsgD family transcriptional regulator/tetratricopeptide (TPR) repeat protein
VDVDDELRRGREAFAAGEWAAATAALSAAEASAPLAPGDLEQLSTALFMVGRDEDHLAALERAHAGFLEAGEPARAGSCAFWIGMRLFMTGEQGRGGGWLARAARLAEQADGDGPQRGYMLIPEMYRRRASGDVDGALATAAAAAEAGRRHEEPDLFVLATHARGLFLIDEGRIAEGLGLLDEAMLAVASGEVSPMPTGIVYCGAIDGCRTAFEPRRAQEWTDALYAWCESQPDMLAFTGACHVHRGELMELHGEWPRALAELDRAAQRATRAGNPRVAAQAAYRRGEILRRQGDLAAAERAYREAAHGGCEPQPGLALLRLAQGDAEAALGAIRRVLDETAAPAARAAVLPAAVEIMLGAGEPGPAAACCEELEEIASARACDLLGAVVAHTRGAVELAGGDARAALPHLRLALSAWHDLAAPYEAARAQLLISEACRALGDEDSAALDAEAAREALAALGAGGARDTQGLTERELQVLRLVAAGGTNRAIADELVLSERTIDRHVSNILAKLRVSSRAAATARAYEHHLL